MYINPNEMTPRARTNGHARRHPSRPPGRGHDPQLELPGLTATHPCPTGCGVKDVPGEWCMCKRCWFRVPRPLRAVLWSAYAHRDEGRAAFQEYRRAVERAIESVNAAREAGL
jgi:hypothetical protein